jgi:hypothetical protein
MATSTPYLVGDLTQADNDTTRATGDLRRTYALGDRISDLAINRDNLFRILSKLRKMPTSDPVFKVLQERSSIHKRYAYIAGHRDWSGSGSVPTDSTTYATTGSVTAIAAETAGGFAAFQMKADYKSAGNITNVLGQSATHFDIGAAGTTPLFFIPGQIIKVNTKSANSGVTIDDFFTAKILSVYANTSTYITYIGVEIIKPLRAAANYYLCSFTATSTPILHTYLYGNGVVASTFISSGGAYPLEWAKTYVVGSSFGEGTGYPDTFKDTPYSTTYGQTQIWKTAVEFTGTAEATELKIVANEKSRVMAMKLQEHTWDIADSIYWSTLATDAAGNRHTQGIVDFILNYGNLFTLATSNNKDDMLDCMSALSDPRYQSFASTLFLMPTYWYNWLHKLGGYALTNLKLASGYASGYGSAAAFDFAGTKSLLDSEISTFSTLYGTINVMRDVHLDGSPIKMLAVNLDKVFYRPLVGNGKNRDTKVYLGVQSIENTGIDATVDLIQTEAGVEITCGEAHAAWL